MEGSTRPRARRRRGAAEGWTRVKDCLRQFVAFMFSNVGIVGLVVGYAIAGAFIFMAIEGGAAGAGAAGAGAAAVTSARGRVVRRLWDATSALNVFSEAEWRALAAAEVAALQRAVVDAALENGLDASPPPRRLVLDDEDGGAGADDGDVEEVAVSSQWSFSGAFLYSLTVITTIGYGNVAPQTEWGKLATILYAIAGMPLFLLYLSNIGDILAKSFKWTYAQCCLCRWCNSSSSSGSKKPRKKSHRRRHRHHSKRRRRPSRTSLRRRASVWSREVAAARGGTAMAVGGTGGIWPGADAWPPDEDMMDGEIGDTEEDSGEDSEDDSSSDDDDDSEDDDEDTDGLEGVDGVVVGGAAAGIAGSSGVVSSAGVGGGGSTRSAGAAAAAAAATTESVTVPVSLCLAIMVGYVCGGALLFAKWEDWDFLDGSYFCFISLSTIGFGDIVPGDRITSGNGVELSFIFCSAYLMLGMALIAMCFSLMQEEVVHKMRGLMRAVKAMGRCLCGGGRRRRGGGGPGSVTSGGGRSAVDIPLEEQRMSIR